MNALNGEIVPVSETLPALEGEFYAKHADEFGERFEELKEIADEAKRGIRGSIAATFHAGEQLCKARDILRGDGGLISEWLTTEFGGEAGRRTAYSFMNAYEAIHVAIEYRNYTPDMLFERFGSIGVTALYKLGAARLDDEQKLLIIERVVDGELTSLKEVNEQIEEAKAEVKASKPPKKAKADEDEDEDDSAPRKESAAEKRKKTDEYNRRLTAYMYAEAVALQCADIADDLAGRYSEIKGRDADEVLAEMLVRVLKSMQKSGVESIEKLRPQHPYPDDNKPKQAKAAKPPKAKKGKAGKAEDHSEPEQASEHDTADSNDEFGIEAAADEEHAEV